MGIHSSQSCSTLVSARLFLLPLCKSRNHNTANEFFYGFSMLFFTLFSGICVGASSTWACIGVPLLMIRLLFIWRAKHLPFSNLFQVDAGGFLLLGLKAHH